MRIESFYSRGSLVDKAIYTVAKLFWKRLCWWWALLLVFGNVRAATVVAVRAAAVGPGNLPVDEGLRQGLSANFDEPGRLGHCDWHAGRWRRGGGGEH